MVQDLAPHRALITTDDNASLHKGTMSAIALHHLSQTHESFSQFLDNAPTQSGIYSKHLRGKLATLQQHPARVDLMRKLVMCKMIPKVTMQAIAVFTKWPKPFVPVQSAHLI